jgi:hypothetical protein
MAKFIGPLNFEAGAYTVPASAYTPKPGYMYRMPGGAILSGFGGFLGISQWKYTGNSTSAPTPFNPEYIHLSRWNLIEEKINRRHAIGGSCGAMSRKVVAADWVVECNMYYNADDPHSKKLIKKFKNKSAIQIILMIGDINTYADFGLNFIQHYKSPLGVITEWGTTCEVLDVVRQSIKIEGNGLMFNLTEPADENVYNNYINQIKGRIPGD